MFPGVGSGNTWALQQRQQNDSEVGNSSPVSRVWVLTLNPLWSPWQHNEVAGGPLMRPSWVPHYTLSGCVCVAVNWFWPGRPGVLIGGFVKKQSHVGEKWEGPSDSSVTRQSILICITLRVSSSFARKSPENNLITGEVQSKHWSDNLQMINQCYRSVHTTSAQCAIWNFPIGHRAIQIIKKYKCITWVLMEQDLRFQTFT